MEKRNQKLTIIVGALLLVIGVSFSYFLATTLINGNGASTVGTTAVINGATLNVEGTLEFDDTGILPGHKNVSAIKLTASGNNQLIAYNLIWKGENGISQINYTVYKSSTKKTISTNCSNKTSVVNGLQVLSEECTINNVDTLGEAIANGSINKGDTKEILVKDEFITATTDGDIKYYYVVLEYPNLDIDQSSDVEATFEGEVTVEESDKKADINILAVYIADDTGNYTETTDIPQSGYSLNNVKSTCSNGATIKWQNSKLITSNLTKSGTSCYLYFDKLEGLNVVIADAKEPTYNMFTNIATTDDGVFKVEDSMYGGTSYFWRGAVTNNYVKFAGFCWRIIRINGDGTIRMIYDGTSCHANGTSTVESIAKTNQTYYGSKDRSEYVGYMFKQGYQRPSLGPTTTTETPSNLKTQTEDWYKTNISDKGYGDKVADGKFCNDRNLESGTWQSQPSSTFYYAARGRLQTNKAPSLACDTDDIYTLKVGAISADEVSFAGGVWGTANQSYYLYNGQYYWTMSPYSVWSNGSSREARVFYVSASGILSNGWVNNTCGVRHVINLNADTIFKAGTDGTIDNPFEVI